MDSGKIEKLTAINDKIGVSENREDLLEEYVFFFRKIFEDKLLDVLDDNFKVLVDTANGATSAVAPKVFKALGIKYDVINNTPDGININQNCGSTHIENLAKKVVEEGYSLGVAYDGDGDRCLCVDEKGNIMDGDIILAIVSDYLKKEGKLKNNTIVATVMSNLGLKKYCKDNDMQFVQTNVGDRYVLENMLENGYNLGGEQSGHIIFLDYNPTGDGILTSLMLIEILLKSKKKASELASKITIYPQVLVNAKVPSDKKYAYKEDEVIKAAIEKIEEEFSGNGRVLIRPSGTEPLVRVMIEGENQEILDQRAHELAKLIEERLK